MFLEHLIYSAAIAIIAGMLCYRYTGRDTSWIIILIAFAPDIDMFANRLLNKVGFTVIFEGQLITHGAFHTIVFMVIFAVIMAFLLHPFGIRFFDSFVYTIIGIGAHFFEDALISDSAYKYFWPISSQNKGLGWLPVGGTYQLDLFGVANVQVLIFGLAVLLTAVLIRTRLEGPGWIRWYMPEKVYTWFLLSNRGDVH